MRPAEDDQELTVRNLPLKVAHVSDGPASRRTEESSNDGRARFANTSHAREAADRLAHALGIPTAAVQIAAFASRSATRAIFHLEGGSARGRLATGGPSAAR